MPSTSVCRRTAFMFRGAIQIGLAVTLTIILPGLAYAQVGSGVGKNDFGIDGNLFANSPNLSPFDEANDWVDGPAGPGVGVLDENGIPIDPTTTFHPIDLTENDDLNRFTGSKVNDNPNTEMAWTTGSSPPKDDIQNGLIHISVEPNGNLWMAAGIDRRTTNGDSYADVELLQNTLVANGDGSFSSDGPDDGRTVGDLVLTIELTQGGDAAAFFVQRWQSDGMGGFTYVDITNTIPAGNAFVAASRDSWPPPTKSSAPGRGSMKEEGLASTSSASSPPM